MTKIDRLGSLRSTCLLLAVFLILLAPSLLAQSSGPDDETCLMCHEGMDQTLLVHELSSEVKDAKIEIKCTSCHEGGAAHVDNPSPETIGNPGNMVSQGVFATCTKCHQPHMELDNIGFDPHVSENFSCTSCHKIHNGNQEDLLLDEYANFCGDCHVSVVNEFQRNSNHPLTDGNVTCLSCHVFTDKNEPDYGHGADANCYKCHAEYGGPFLYNHDATSSFIPQGEGCTACHMPHGSPNERLLKQPGNGLCTQCHGIPPGHLTVHDGIGSKFGCVDCHTGIHGSFDNAKLLDPNLGSKISIGPSTCYCHNVDN